MPRKPRPAPRRVPHQERARVTVDALVSATAQVLLKEGYDACTTNRVARVAGVSVGSLYQYFPDKEALVMAVVEQHLTRLREGLEARLLELGGADLPTAVEAMIGAMLDAQRIQPKLHRVLLEQVPRIGALKRLHELHSQYEPVVTAWLEAHAEQVSVESASTAAFVLIAAVEGVLTRTLLQRPAWLEAGVLERHLSRLVLAYLAPELVATHRAPAPEPAGRTRRQRQREA